MDRDTSRREFVQAVGMGVAGLWTFHALELRESEHFQDAACAPPGKPGTPSAFVRDCRPIRARRAAGALTAAEVAQLKAAYKAMRDLDTADPSDPRGFKHQANIHCYNCSGPINVHSSWKFFAWHRAYLYFHERILGKLVGDENFRLPYWNWDSPLQRKLPGGYVTPNDNTNPLFNPTRVLAPTDSIPEEDVGSDVMSGILELDTFPEFGGTAGGPGVPEGTPHGAVHVDVGGNMSTFANAARDPIFYAHHANIDKLWSDWNNVDSAHTNPSAAGFLDLTFTFYDENKTWRSIRASQLLDHERRLRYVYEPYRPWERLPCLIWRKVPLDWSSPSGFILPQSGRRVLPQTPGPSTPVRLHLEDLQLPTNKSAVYRIYFDQAAAQADPGPTSPSYLGSVAVVLNDPENKHPIRGTRRVILDVSQRAQQLFNRQGRVALFLVERGVPASARRVIPVRARDVFLTSGVPETIR